MNFQQPFIKNFKTMKWQPTNFKYLYWQYIKNVVIVKIKFKSVQPLF